MYGRNYRADQDLDELVGVSAEQLLVIVAGAEGVYSAVAPSWGGGIHRNPHICAAVNYGAACEIPIRSDAVE